MFLVLMLILLIFGTPPVGIVVLVPVLVPVLVLVWFEYGSWGECNMGNNMDNCPFRQRGYPFKIHSPKAEMERAPSHVEALVDSTKNYQDDLEKLGLIIKQHEDHIKSLRTQNNILEESILEMQVIIGKYHTCTESVTEKLDAQIEEGTSEYSSRGKRGKSAAGLTCQLKACHEIQVSHSSPLVEDVLGIVGTLGKVNDENLGRVLGEYVGKQDMMALVCKTVDGVMFIKSRASEGVRNRNSGLSGIGSSIVGSSEGRFRVICLDNLRPYVGEFVANDPQRRINLLKPKLPGGEIPHGFIGYAVNLVHIDDHNLFCVTSSGHGLRETLFYHLFSHLQVYRTKEDMQQALPFISDGAVSLDGGIMKSPSVFYLGSRDVNEDAQLKFPMISGKSSLPANYYEIEKNIKSKKWNQERLLDEMRREQSLLDQAKFNFEIKKKEFLRFLAQSSPNAPAQQQQNPAGRERFTPR